MSTYRKLQIQKAEKLVKSKSPVFYGAKFERPLILKEKQKNFYEKIYPEVKYYFDKNKISWWAGKGIPGNVLSSQVACLNHLFALREDKKAVLQILSSVKNDFTDVLRITTDKYSPAFIQFEAVSQDDYLNEGHPVRGKNTTSIDALIYAKDQNEKHWLVLIEWKYTEFYTLKNKATEGCNKKAPCAGEKRLNRYKHLILKSKFLKEKTNWQCYFYEPFYQLMRQTLWAEQIIKNKDKEPLKADNFFHIIVVPAENKEFLTRLPNCINHTLPKFIRADMETAWKKLIFNPENFKILSPVKFLANLDKTKYNHLLKYLKERYWDSK